MIKILSIRKAIVQIIDENTSFKLYYQRADEHAAFPYLTFDISNSTDDGTLERFLMDIDGYGNTTNTTALETMMNDVDALLHRRQFTVYETSLPDNPVAMMFTIYRENRLTFDESDRNVYRRRYIYQIRTYVNQLDG